MKKWLSISVAAATLALVAVGAPPAQAASRKIHGFTAIPGVDGRALFTESNCNPALANDAPNGISGIDTLIIEVPAAWRGLPKSITWSTNTIVGTFPSLRVGFNNASCSSVSPSGFVSATTRQGAWSIPVPSTARWMTLTMSFGRDTTITY